MITVVNEQDEVIESKSRSDLVYPDDIYRASCLWLTNSAGEFLLTQRSFDKDKDPGVWDLAVSGTVRDGESYQECMVREAREELGLTDLLLKFGPKMFVEHSRRLYIQFFYSTCDVEIDQLILQEGEVV